MKASAYVGGPMRGYPKFNFDTFDAVVSMLRDTSNWYVYSPAEHDLEVWRDLRNAPGFKEGDNDLFMASAPATYNFIELMKWDLQIVSLCEHLVLLPGWEKSTGAKIERATAEATGSSIWLAKLDTGGWHLILDPAQKRMRPAELELVDEWVDEPHVRRVEGEDIEALEQVHAQVPRDEFYDKGFVAIGDSRFLADPPPLPKLHYPAPTPNLDKVMADIKAGVYDPRNVDGTTIQTSATGDQKGAKSVELGRLPQAALRGVAEHFHMGSEKYPDVAPGVANWSLGYDWSLSLEALKRHLSLWESGEDNDPEFGTSHLRAVGFHALVLAEFEIQGWGTDDRRTPEARNRHVNDDHETHLALHRKFRTFNDLRQA